jgi:hypothetical protein
MLILSVMAITADTNAAPGRSLGKFPVDGTIRLSTGRYAGAGNVEYSATLKGRRVPSLP